MLSWFSGCPGIFSEKLSFFVHNTCHHVPHLTAEQQKSPGSEAGCTKSSSESRLSIRIVTCGIVAESPSLHPPPAPRRASPPPPARSNLLTHLCLSCSASSFSHNHHRCYMEAQFLELLHNGPNRIQRYGCWWKVLWLQSSRWAPVCTQLTLHASLVDGQSNLPARQQVYTLGICINTSDDPAFIYTAGIWSTARYFIYTYSILSTHTAFYPHTQRDTLTGSAG